MEIMFENGDFGRYYGSLSHIHERLAQFSADDENKAETLEHLSKAVKYAIKRDELGEYTPR